jgi:hypothetical protein
MATRGFQRSWQLMCRLAGRPLVGGLTVRQSTGLGASATWRKVRRALDEELARLPPRCRAPLVVCYLEGRTQKEAARILGWSLGSVRGSVRRGRDLLRARLARRGFAPSTVLVAALLSEPATTDVPPDLLAATVKAGVRARKEKEK